MQSLGTVIVVTLLLVGCGNEQSSTNNGYGTTYDESTPYGLRVRYVDSHSPRIETLDAIFKEVAACMGSSLPNGPLVIFAGEITSNEDVPGIYLPASGTIVILNSLAFDQPGGYWTVKHEFVHHILHLSGFPLDKNKAHDSPYFACAN